MLDTLMKFLENSFGYLWFVLLAIWGGTVNYISRLKSGAVASFSFIELIGEWVISGFAGLLTAYICMEAEMEWGMVAFFAGISGHLGGRAVFMFENYVKSKFPGGN